MGGLEGVVALFGGLLDRFGGLLDRFGGLPDRFLFLPRGLRPLLGFSGDFEETTIFVGDTGLISLLASRSSIIWLICDLRSDILLDRFRFDGSADPDVWLDGIYAPDEFLDDFDFSRFIMRSFLFE